MVYKDEIAWNHLQKLIIDIDPSKIFIITDENTKTHCLPYFLKKFKTEKKVETCSISAGEIHKNIATCLLLWNELSEKGADRKTLIINLGGGVVTDLGGFVASTFKRGLKFINIPTTLLAMVDASVGGKNGVDLGHIKNQIGVINNPEMVVIDLAFLKTLPEAQKVSGLAEMLKHGIIHSYNYWNQIKNADLNDEETLKTLIWESIEIKNEIVKKDPLEKNLRKTLNFGHTLGHAIESYFLENETKKPLLHGEAIAVGMILATYISYKLLDFPKETLTDIAESIFRSFPKQDFDQNDIDQIVSLLVYDKKNVNGKVYFVLLNDIGKHKIDCVVPNDLINNAFNYYKNFKNIS